MAESITMTVNGRSQTVTTDPERPLLDVLREDLQLTGAKFGCGEGQCGACTVLLNGRPIFSCSTRVSTAAGREIRTIEGLADGDRLHPIQEAFIAAGAPQCGYCMPGMIMTAVALLESRPNPTDEQIRTSMQRNVCRCCTYPRVTDAIKRAANGNGGQA